MCLNAQWWIQLKNKIKNFNLFEHWKKKEEEDLKTQRLSTFIFLILLVLSIVALLLYTHLSHSLCIIYAMILCSSSKDCRSLTSGYVLYNR